MELKLDKNDLILLMSGQVLALWVNTDIGRVPIELKVSSYETMLRGG